jgi:hypothetical protein
MMAILSSMPFLHAADDHAPRPILECAATEDITATRTVVVAAVAVPFPAISPETVPVALAGSPKYFVS